MLPSGGPIAVVGRGLIGAAAARHLTLAGVEVTLIGPGEPAERGSFEGPFSSHHDSGRITRIAASDPVWSELGARALGRYSEIAAASDVDFYTGAGLVAAAPDAEHWVTHSAERGGEAEVLDADETRRRFGIAFAGGLPVAHESEPAGFIDPRRLVAAQTEATRRAGGSVIEAAATGLSRHGSGWRVEVDGADPVVVHRVIVASGAFGSNLLARPLDLVRRPRTVVLAEIGPGPDLPSLVWIGCDHPALDALDEVYWVPPTEYPDGRVLLKIGGKIRPEPIIDEADLPAWFQGDGDSAEAAALQAALQVLLPDRQVTPVGQLPCVYTGTPTGLPYIGEVDDGLAVAIGGNGSGAKSSDELGRLVADVSRLGRWNDPVLGSDLFAPRMGSDP
ncbi:MAG: FAD-binding oxidoreductase [Actinomycetia bacterium]|nr:FAD-binding oxidoreductase [Actinomycetes bacterium]